MSLGLLSAKTTVRIQLDAGRGIVSACEEVFRPEHRETARTMIFESEMLLECIFADQKVWSAYVGRSWCRSWLMPRAT